MRKDVIVVTTAATATTVVAVALLVRHWRRRHERRWRRAQRILRKFARECATPVPKLWHIAYDLVSSMQTSLSNSYSTNSIDESNHHLPMLASYIASLPSGDEKGLYYGINLRGTDFLILQGRLGGKNEAISELQRQEISIPSNVIDASSKELFDFIALELAKFIALNNGDKKQRIERIMGFTISYPVDQCAASSNTAIKWKSLSLEDPVESIDICFFFLGHIKYDCLADKDLVNEFNQALESHGVDMRVFEMVDETIGHLAGGRYFSSESVAAITLGMGTKAAYIEPAGAVPKLHDLQTESGEVVIDLQWGDFKSSYLPITKFDVFLDQESSNPGNQFFEKMISGMYLGEIVRIILLKMARETHLFGKNIPKKLATPYVLRSPDMAAMHQDTSEDYDVIDEKLRSIFGIYNSTTLARELVAEVCDVVAERGARLVAAGIVGIVKKLGRTTNKKSVVTIEGGLYQHYRVFRNYLHSSVWEMLGNDVSDNVTLEHSHGGSGAGAIFLAAAQTKDAP